MCASVLPRARASRKQLSYFNQSIPLGATRSPSNAATLEYELDVHPEYDPIWRARARFAPVCPRSGNSVFIDSHTRFLLDMFSSIRVHTTAWGGEGWKPPNVGPRTGSVGPGAPAPPTGAGERACSQ